MKNVLLAFLLIGIVEALSDLIIYDHLISPILPTVKSVPFYWWLLLFLPSIICCIFLGARAKSYMPTVWLALAGGIASHIFNYYAAINHFPGHSKSWAIESAAIWWSAGLVLQVSFYFVLMALGVLIFKRYAKVT